MSNLDVDKMKNANQILGIQDDLSIERNRNLIFIYSRPKVGSTTLVSSLRISASWRFTVSHIHNDRMLQVLHKIKDTTVMEIIQYNRYLGKNVYVLDVYRSPIEQKISTFFENIHSYHFNVPIEHLNTFDIQRVIKRFNEVFPYLSTNDHYRTKYDVEFPCQFDFTNKYIMAEKDGIKYYKIRLKDSADWGSLLKSIFNTDIYIVRDYETSKKPIHALYSSFKTHYQIPHNLFSMIEEDTNLVYYYSTQERSDYLNDWRRKMSHTTIKPFTQEEYKFYHQIALENSYISEFQVDHYIDGGCLCIACRKKRRHVLSRLMKGEPIHDTIHHREASVQYLQEKIKTLPVYKRPKKQNAANIVKSNFFKTFS